MQTWAVVFPNCPPRPPSPHPPLNHRRLRRHPKSNHWNNCDKRPQAKVNSTSPNCFALVNIERRRRRPRWYTTSLSLVSNNFPSPTCSQCRSTIWRPAGIGCARWTSSMICHECWPNWNQWTRRLACNERLPPRRELCLNWWTYPKCKWMLMGYVRHTPAWLFGDDNLIYICQCNYTICHCLLLAPNEYDCDGAQVLVLGAWQFIHDCASKVLWLIRGCKSSEPTHYDNVCRWLAMWSECALLALSWSLPWCSPFTCKWILVSKEHST